MRAVLLFTFIWLASTPLQAAIPADLQQEIEKTLLYQKNHWLKLLHFKNNESEIDDDDFFLAVDGKTNPRSELLATVEGLINDHSDSENSLYCQFIARASWLLEQLPSLKNQMVIPGCQALYKELADLKAHSVTLILASAHINSPASAFGHTFLRIDSKENTPLISYAVSYAAETAETNGFIYAYRGIFGGYTGKYSILPYYEKIKEYNDLEQRDIWEYRLDLTPQEIHTMALHIMEIRQFDTDYFFFQENCSYNILWLLEVARDSLDLTSQFSLNSIPIDTLRVVDDAGIISQQNYRPSVRKTINFMAQQLHDESARQFVSSNEYDFKMLTNLETDQKIIALDLAVELLKIRHIDKEIETQPYTALLLTLLRERSKLGVRPGIDIPPPDSPLKGHYSNRVSVGFKHREKQEDVYQISLKPAYHDIYDVESGYLEGAFINFVDTTLSISDSQTRLENIGIIEIQSLAIQDDVFNPVSWQVGFGLERPFEQDLYTYLRLGLGKTWGKPDVHGFVMLAPGLYYDNETLSSLTLSSGLLATWANIKAGVTLESEKFNSHELRDEYEVFLTYALSKSFAGHVRWSKTNIEMGDHANASTQESLLLSALYYF